jgi:DNA-directed RNA polymerase specialized sigma24 family protein
MKSEIKLKKDWVVTPEAFDRLLDWLAPGDREAAAEKYEKIRLKLLKLFKWRNCVPEEEYVDLTMDRVTRRISEGISTEVSDPYLYFHGTALNVIREFWRGRQKFKQEGVESLDHIGLTAKSAEQEIDERVAENLEAIRLGCMRGCVHELPEELRAFIVGYHHGENKKEIRKTLAEKMGVTINVLRIKACRIREGLQKCAEKCVSSVK